MSLWKLNTYVHGKMNAIENDDAYSDLVSVTGTLRKMIDCGILLVPLEVIIKIEQKFKLNEGECQFSKIINSNIFINSIV